MARSIMAVFTDPRSPGDEDEYNAWYDDVHLKELLEIPGVVSATRYRLSPAADPASSSHRHLAVYEVEGDPAAVLTELGARAGALTMSPALDLEGSLIQLWEPVGGGTAAP